MRGISMQIVSVTIEGFDLEKVPERKSLSASGALGCHCLRRLGLLSPSLTLFYACVQVSLAVIKTYTQIRSCCISRWCLLQAAGAGKGGVERIYCHAAGVIIMQQGRGDQ